MGTSDVLIVFNIEKMRMVWSGKGWYAWDGENTIKLVPGTDIMLPTDFDWANLNADQDNLGYPRYMAVKGGWERIKWNLPPSQDSYG